MVDDYRAERRKTERERKGNYITSPAALQHREREVLCEKEKF